MFSNTKFRMQVPSNTIAMHACTIELIIIIIIIIIIINNNNNTMLHYFESEQADNTGNA